MEIGKKLYTLVGDKMNTYFLISIKTPVVTLSRRLIYNLRI